MASQITKLSMRKALLYVCVCVCVGIDVYMPLALAAGQRTHDCCACPGPQAANLMRMINLPMEAENGKWLHLSKKKQIKRGETTTD